MNNIVAMVVLDKSVVVEDRWFLRRFEPESFVPVVMSFDVILMNKVVDFGGNTVNDFRGSVGNVEHPEAGAFPQGEIIGISWEDEGLLEEYVLLTL
jgi:hypothetical protein